MVVVELDLALILGDSWPEEAGTGEESERARDSEVRREMSRKGGGYGCR